MAPRQLKMRAPKNISPDTPSEGQFVLAPVADRRGVVLHALAHVGVVEVSVVSHNGRINNPASTAVVTKRLHWHCLGGPIKVRANTDVTHVACGIAQQKHTTQTRWTHSISHRGAFNVTSKASTAVEMNTHIILFCLLVVAFAVDLHEAAPVVDNCVRILKETAKEMSGVLSFVFQQSMRKAPSPLIGLQRVHS
ncbi:hypothetical protein LSAT2_025783 [Lamellibrachia satsuma]|nr:hypothetical protein LSAT2_025783 [Lamellibrachia satsuma]